MTFHNDFVFKTNSSSHIAETARAMSQQATGNDSSIKAFHDVDERQRVAIRELFGTKNDVSAIARQFGISEREVWLAAKHDRSLGPVLNERFWRHGLTLSLGNGLNVSEDQAQRRLQYVACRLKRRIWGSKRQKDVVVIAFRHKLPNRNKKKHELAQGSRNWSHKEQMRLVDRHYQALRTCEGKNDQLGEHWHAVMAVRGITGGQTKKLGRHYVKLKETGKKNIGPRRQSMLFGIGRTQMRFTATSDAKRNTMTTVIS